MKHTERNSLWTGKKRKYLPLQIQRWQVVMSLCNPQTKQSPGCPLRFLSCSIAHEMLGPEGGQKHSRNHWHETAAPSTVLPCPGNGLSLRPGSHSEALPPQQLVTQPGYSPATCRMSLQTEAVRSSCLGKGTETKARLLSSAARSGAGLKLILIFSDILPYTIFLGRSFFPSSAPLQWAKASTSSFLPFFLSTFMA